VGKTSYDSMNERRNEEGNEKWSEEGKRKRKNILTKCGCLWQGAKCDLVNDVKLFIVNGCVITYDPWKVVLDD
jgi:hypothetical protein